MLIVGVVGAGTMGSGIAQVAIAAGESVKLFDPMAEASLRGRDMIKKNLDFLVGKKKLTSNESSDIFSKLEIVNSLSDLASCDLVIEAIVENESIKKDLFKNLESIVSPEVILATNTSSISITALSNELEHPERLVGMHFFNPAPRMKLIEVIKGLRTSDSHVDYISSLVMRWGKAPVVTKSTPGFIVNRVARPFYGEALRVLTEFGTDHSSLDDVIRDCGGFPLGPCQLMDLIGLDVNLSVTQSVYEATAFDPRYAPSLLQQELVRAGKLGRKSGEGFYTYPIDIGSAEIADPIKKNELKNHTIRFINSAGIQSLIARLTEAGADLVESTQANNMPTIALTDGRTATQRAHDESISNLVLIDFCLNFETTQRIAMSHAEQCDPVAVDHIADTLTNAGCKVTIIQDVAGMIVARTVAMLVNEASDLVHQRITTPSEVDMAMTLGTGYPIGPLLWADQIGLKNISDILKHLYEHYGSPRYRISPLIQRKSITNQQFHGAQ
jgi:3-hydroxybutyryl-CoA dehydrogenase